MSEGQPAGGAGEPAEGLTVPESPPPRQEQLCRHPEASSELDLHSMEP